MFAVSWLEFFRKVKKDWRARDLEDLNAYLQRRAVETRKLEELYADMQLRAVEAQKLETDAQRRARKASDEIHK